MKIFSFNYRLKIKWKILFIAVPLLFLLSACWNSSNPEYLQAKSLKGSQSNWEIVIENNNRELWDIPMSKWFVNILFKFTNSWEENVALFEWITGCMCTTASVISSDWIVSPRIKMPWHWLIAQINQILKPWESAKLIATFDPNAHWPKLTWPIMREITIKTNSIKTPELKFKFQGNVINK